MKDVYIKEQSISAANRHNLLNLPRYKVQIEVKKRKSKIV